MNVTATWWITTAPLSEGGQKVAGPYTSQEEALKQRVVLEAASGVTYWVDDQPPPMTRDDYLARCCPTEPGQEG